MIPKEISKRVLTIGPYRKDGKGGMAAVVNNLEPYYDTFYYISSTRSKRNFVLMGLYFSSAIIRLIYYILFKRIKIVHIHGASYGSFSRKKILIDISHRLNIKIVYHIHGGEFSLFYDKMKEQDKSSIVKETLDKVDTLIVLSQSWKGFYSQLTDENKIVILNNMVPLPTQNIAYREKSSSVINFLFLGEIVEGKGIFDLLEVINNHRDSLEGSFFLHIGGKGDNARLEREIEDNNLQSMVKFGGWVSGQKKEELLSTCDIFILPSYNEGLPVSILEAMSYGMPVISTTVGGIPELIANEENGFLVEPGDKPALYESITYYLNHREKINIMGKNNKEKVRSYTPEEVIPHLNNIYKALL